MKREDSKKAAKEKVEDVILCNICSEEIDNEESNYEAGRRDALYDFGEELFIAGADWRINDVWHDANEEPKYDEFFLYENAVQAFHVDCIFPSEDEVFLWDGYIKDWGLMRWAYIKDLIPNKKG